MTDSRTLQSRHASIAVAILAGVRDQRLLTRVPVTKDDLKHCRDETWLSGIRAGVLPIDGASLAMSVQPGPTIDRDRIDGFQIELAGANKIFRKRFSINSLDRLVKLEIARLIQEGSLDLEDKYQYCLVPGHDLEAASENDADSASAPSFSDSSRTAGGNMSVKVRSEPIELDEFSLKEWMANSEPLYRGGKPSDDDVEPEPPRLPIFVPRSVWEEGRELARLGGKRESAGVWTGRLCRDIDSPELALVLEACLRAEHADEQEHKVEFSDQTWAGVQQRLQMRRRRLNRPHEIIVGSVHGHNFQPEADSEGRRACDACHLLDHCTRTTAVASADDHLWHSCVFAGQPWAILLVWGWNAREEEDFRLYGLHDGALRPRGLRVLKD